MLIVFSPLWRGTRISRSSRPASSMSSWRKSSSMRPATRRARTGHRRSTFTTRVSGSWKCQKSRHQWKKEKTVQPKLYRSLFPHDVFLSGGTFGYLLFCMFEPCRARTVRMSTFHSGRRRRTSPGCSATPRALFYKDIQCGCPFFVKKSFTSGVYYKKLLEKVCTLSKKSLEKVYILSKSRLKKFVISYITPLKK